MQRLCSIIAVSLALSACASPSNRVGVGLENYVRRPVAELISVLGAPNAETAVAGQEVFVWGDPRIAMLPEMQGGAGVGGSNAPPDQYECSIRVFVGPDQRIVSWDFLGNEVGCQSYAERFSSKPS